MSQVLATGFAVLVVERLGRKILLILSAFFMCLSISGLGAYFYLDENIKTDQNPGGFDPDTVDSLGWLPLACLILFIVAFSCGFGPLAWAMNVELFPR